jgi:hypothetical protein
VAADGGVPWGAWGGVPWDVWGGVAWGVWGGVAWGVSRGRRRGRRRRLRRRSAAATSWSRLRRSTQSRCLRLPPSALLKPRRKCGTSAEVRQQRCVSRYGTSAEVRRQRCVSRCWTSAEVRQQRCVSRYGTSADVRRQRCVSKCGASRWTRSLIWQASASYGKCLIWQVPHMASASYAGDRSHVTDRRAPRSQVNSTQVTSRTAGLVGRRLVRCAAKEADDTEGTQRLLNRRHRAGLLSRRKGLGRGDLVRGGVHGRVRGRVWMVRWTIGCEW